MLPSFSTKNSPENRIDSVAIVIKAQNSDVLHEFLGKKRVLDHVIDTCLSVQKYCNRTKDKYGVSGVYLSVPKGDALKESFDLSTITVVEDTSYVQLLEKTGDEFICTVSCENPLIPAYVISKHISLALIKKYDYISNFGGIGNFTPKGVECEVFSIALAEWAEEQEKPDSLSMLRNSFPDWVHVGSMIGFFDFSSLNFKARNRDELIKLREEYHKIGKALSQAENIYGRDAIHRF